VILKGGLVLELRLERARTTKDIDLRVSGSPNEILETLQKAGQMELGDYMTFIIQPDKRLPELTGDGLIYEGYRFRAECRLGGKIYGQAFGVDVAFGDPLVGDPDLVVAEGKLAFAGVTPPTLRLYPLVSHIAEKLHAFTLPRVRSNSRVKDLPDIALLATIRPIYEMVVRTMRRVGPFGVSSRFLILIFPFNLPPLSSLPVPSNRTGPPLCREAIDPRLQPRLRPAAYAAHAR
jgi:hypothetical protein